MNAREWMRTASLPFVLAVLALAGCRGAGSTPGGKEAASWVPLFNGRDLAGWEMVGGAAGSWVAAEGILACTGGESGWLSTIDVYEDFEIEIDFRVPPGGNSGVFIRSPRTGNPAHDGMEIQVLDDDAPIHKDIKSWQHTGSLYGVVPPSKPMQRKAGEWNRYRIRCQGRRVTVHLNGETVVDADLDVHEELKNRPRRGYIGVQNHGSRIEYRNVRVRRLD